MCITEPDRSGERSHDTYINYDGDAHQQAIETIHPVVFVQPVGDELALDKPHEEDVQNDVDDQEDALLEPVPYVVRLDPTLADLEAGRNPDDEDADIDHANDQSDI